MSVPRSARALAALTAAASAVALAVAGAPQASASSRHPLPNTAPRWVAKARNLGRPATDHRQTVQVYLAPKGGLSALKADVDRVSDPKSAGYRQFLSAAQYHAAYDATEADVTAVSSWLKGSGLTVTGVESHHRSVSATGSTAALEKAFGVRLGSYRHAGQSVVAPSGAASVPDALASTVMTVRGLDTTAHRIAHAAASPGFRPGRPCSTSYGQLKATYKADFKTPLPAFQGKTLPYAVCGYTGPQYRAAYEGNTSSLGRGATVAITDAYASPTIAADANTYAERHGDGSYRAGQLSQVEPRGPYTRQKLCDPTGWYGEETLDVEAVHATAPGANIRYYASASCLDDDFLDTLARVVDDDQASIVSNSWADVESVETSESVAAYEQVLLQGARQGIAFMFSSGDDGDQLANTGLKQVAYPASDPYATAVGGTSDAIGADGRFRFQTGWGTERYALSGKKWVFAGFLYGAGGGASTLFPRPSYQSGVVPGRYGSGRAVPDVGLDGDPNTGMLVGQTQKFSDGTYYDEYRIGGTSLASPLYAGMAAVATENAGGRLGFLNPAIYAQATTGVFTDVKGTAPDAGQVRADYVNSENPDDGITYSVRTFNQDSSLATARGWDDVTGVGSPNAGWLTSFTK